MRKVLLIALMLITTLASADARHRHRHGHFSSPDEFTTDGAAPPEFAPERRRRGRADGADVTGLVPRGWQLQPPDANWKGKRFLSPDGTSWFAAYSSSVGDEPAAAHMKAIAFGDREVLTYLRGERTWIAVSGVKGDRIFYRKAVIACAGTTWHHIAFEYPVFLKREMDRFVIGAAETVDRTENEGCENAAPTANQDQPGPSSTGSAAR
jgi:hypothetical protein